MSSLVNVAIHASQWPENVRRDLLESLRSRKLNHKFLYDGFKQTQKWLALHQAFSPSRADADCAAIYDRSFAAAVKLIKASSVHLLGLGCGGGEKDTRLLKALKARGAEIYYTPYDVSVAMTLEARRTALAVVPEPHCFPFVCDLGTADDLPEALKHHVKPRSARLITFFGMIPNFESQLILPKVASLVGQRDYLLFSANLAPGRNYAAGMKIILPQYDNAPTRDWLMAFLLDLGVGRSDGELRFAIENDPAGSGLQRVTASFHFARSRLIQAGAERFQFHRGESIRVFFSNRHTPKLVRRLLTQHGLDVRGQWIAKSGEEGVFLCVRAHKPPRR
jgi:uncharacterized SAM-dependent methyltransferase